MMRCNQIMIAAAAALATAGAPASLAVAQSQPRAVTETADRLDRISRMAGRNLDPAARAFRTPRGGEMASWRLGAAVERVSFGVREFPVRRQEVIAIDAGPRSRESAESLGFELMRSFRLEALGISVDVLRTPRRMSVRRALQRLQEVDPDGVYEANSLFMPLGEALIVSEMGPAPPTGDGAVASRRPIGIIDTGVESERAQLSGAVLGQENFGRGEGVTPRAHGTAVAALARRYGVESMLVADVFSGEPAFADAESLARALDWLAAQEVDVINMSLAGPPNILLERAVAAASERGRVIVAAVGNDGPDALPQYPAAYPTVIGVTAVDVAHNVYARANRGRGVDVAAYGVDVTPLGEDGEKPLSGTSYATPLVSAYLAQKAPAHEGLAYEDGVALLAAAALDLGEPGYDPVFGHGVLIFDAYRTASGVED